MAVDNNWKAPQNKTFLKNLIEKFGEYKYVQIIGYDGESRYFKVSTKRIITKGIKAQELLAKKYGKELSKEEYEKESKKAKVSPRPIGRKTLGYARRKK